MSILSAFTSRWPCCQFSLRALFILSMVAAIGGSLAAARIRQLERDLGTVKSLERSCVRLQYRPIGCVDGWLLFLVGRRETQMPYAATIWLGACPDDIIESLAQVSTLEYVCNSAPGVLDDRSIVALSKLPRLKELYCLKDGVTDEGVAQLRRAQHLERLDLAFTRVTDASIEHLACMPNLRYVGLYGTAVSEEGIRRLAAVRPDIAVSVGSHMDMADGDAAGEEVQ